MEVGAFQCEQDVFDIQPVFHPLPLQKKWVVNPLHCFEAPLTPAGRRKGEFIGLAEQRLVPRWYMHTLAERRYKHSIYKTWPTPDSMAGPLCRLQHCFDMMP